MLSSSALLVAAALTVGQAGEQPSNFEHLKAVTVTETLPRLGV